MAREDSTPTRASKRRRLNAEDNILSPQSHKSPSVLESVSSGLSNLSKKFFETRTSRADSKQDDSTYGSKEDSVQEEDASLQESDTIAVEVSSHGTFTEVQIVNEPSSSLRDSSMRKRTPSQKAVAADKDVQTRSSTGQKRTASTRGVDVPKSTNKLTKPATEVAQNAPVRTNDTRADSTSARRATRRVQASGARRLEIVEPTSSPVRSILTPSRSNRPGKRKSVAFEEKDVEVQMSFKDVVPSKQNAQADLIVEQIPQREDAAPTTSVQATSYERENDTGDSEEQTVDAIELIAEQHEPDAWVSGLTAPENDHITRIKAVVLCQLTTSAHHKEIPTRLQGQYDQLYGLLDATVATGESNSVLMLGPRGSGKSFLTDSVVSQLKQDHNDEFHVIRLNGFVQTDDKLALREIWRQLGREMDISEDDVNEVNSYADTLTSLLGLLSHPDELFDPASMQIDRQPDQTNIRTSKSIIFILDEFDLFTNHARQTLLYNLFDIAQSRKAPIAVVGCSTRIDVVDCLEKRVKSRFSHRWLLVPPINTLTEWEDSLSKTLQVETVDKLLLTGEVKEVEELILRRQWNQHIQDHFLPSTQIQDLLKRTFYSTKSIPDLFTAMHFPISTLQLPDPRSELGIPISQEQDTITKRRTKQSTKSKTSQKADSSPQSSLPPSFHTRFPVKTSPPSPLSLLPSLPILHLTLLAAATRLETIYGLTTLSLTSVYAHYLDLMARARMARSSSASAGGLLGGTMGMKNYGRTVAGRAWEDLLRWEILIGGAGAGGGGVGGGKDDAGPGAGASGSRMCRVDVSLEEVAWAVKRKMAAEKGAAAGMGELVLRWCSEI